MIETATFWKDGPEIETGELRTEDIGTEVFFLPAATHTEKEGSFTNTQRLLQWRHKAVEPPGRLPLGAVVHVPPRPAHPRRSSPAPATRATARSSTSPGTTRRTGPHEEPDAEAVLREISGVDGRRRRAVRATRELRDDGSTACGCWIYCGVYADERQPGRPPQAAAASRTGSPPSGAGRGR